LALIIIETPSAYLYGMLGTTTAVGDEQDV
jgi:hypothetical protein